MGLLWSRSAVPFVVLTIPIHLSLHFDLSAFFGVPIQLHHVRNGFGVPILDVLKEDIDVRVVAG